VQKEFQARNAELPENRKMQFRIGVNLEDVIEEDETIYGDGVNIAAKLEALAKGVQYPQPRNDDRTKILGGNAAGLFGL
jgi:class 3 adenylate cyclase